MLKKKKHVYSEYFVNDSHMKKLYHTYIKQSMFDKILDILVFLAILFTAVTLALEFLFTVDETVMHVVHSFSLIILLIFILELIREYARTPSSRNFLAHHWVDVLLVAVLSFYFLFVTYLGFAKLKILAPLRTYVQEAKHFRVLFNFFKR